MSSPARHSPPSVAFLGPPGTYSHEACLQRFGAVATLRPCATFAEALATLTTPGAARTAAALLPMENSLEGPVTQTLDLLAQSPRVTVCESFPLAIRHCLLARRGVANAAIATVYSHPQALAQCQHWLARHLPRAVAVPCASTADAARRAAAEPAAAAVASQLCARLHGLHPLACAIQDGADNVTRFVLVRRRAVAASRPAAEPRAGRRALLFLVLPNRPGALLHALQPFQTAGINLSFIQSRPLAQRPGEYGFFIETDVAGRETAFLAVTAFLRAFVEDCRLLGNYPCRPRPLSSRRR